MRVIGLLLSLSLVACKAVDQSATQKVVKQMTLTDTTNDVGERLKGVPSLKFINCLADLESVVQTSAEKRCFIADLTPQELMPLISKSIGSLGIAEMAWRMDFGFWAVRFSMTESKHDVAFRLSRPNAEGDYGDPAYLKSKTIGVLIVGEPPKQQ